MGMTLVFTEQGVEFTPGKDFKPSELINDGIRFINMSVELMEKLKSQVADQKDVDRVILEMLEIWRQFENAQMRTVEKRMDYKDYKDCMDKADRYVQGMTVIGGAKG